MIQNIWGTQYLLYKLSGFVLNVLNLKDVITIITATKIGLCIVVHQITISNIEFRQVAS
jgi:hypothetical protein